MDIFQDIDFSQLIYDTPVSNNETIPASSDCNDILNHMDQDIDYSQLFHDAPVSINETIPASSGFNDILDLNYTDCYQDIILSPLFQEEPDIKSNSLNCVENVYESVSNAEVNSLSCVENVHDSVSRSASSDCNDKKKAKVYTCSTCNKTFRRNSHLKRHVMIHEKKTTVHACSTCGKTFSCNSYLKQHMKIHTREKLFSCEACLIRFSTKTNLKRHQLLHNSDVNMKRSFECEHCGYMFTRKDQLKQHVSYYLNSTYTCTKCNQKFCRWNDLKVHVRHCLTVVRSELSQTPMQNPYCEKVQYFKRKNELNECSTTTFENCEDITLDLHAYLNSLTSIVENEMKYQFYEKQCFKSCFMLKAIITRSLSEEESECCNLYLNSNTIIIFSENMITKCIDLVFTEMIEQYSKFKVEWKLCKIIKLDVLTTKFTDEENY